MGDFETAAKGIEDDGSVMFFIGTNQGFGSRAHKTNTAEAIRLIQTGDHVAACALALNEMGEQMHAQHNDIDTRTTSIGLGLFDGPRAGLGQIASWVENQHPGAHKDFKNSPFPGLAMFSNVRLATSNSRPAQSALLRGAAPDQTKIEPMKITIGGETVTIEDPAALAALLSATHRKHATKPQPPRSPLATATPIFLPEDKEMLIEEGLTNG